MSAEERMSKIGAMADKYDIGVMEMGVRRLTVHAAYRARTADKSVHHAVIAIDDTLFPELFMEALGIGLAVMAEREKVPA